MRSSLMRCRKGGNLPCRVGGRLVVGQLVQVQRVSGCHPASSSEFLFRFRLRLWSGARRGAGHDGDLFNLRFWSRLSFSVPAFLQCGDHLF